MSHPDRPRARQAQRSRDAYPELEPALTAAVRDLVLGSPRLTQFAGGAAAVQPMLDRIENVWLEHQTIRIHCDVQCSESAKAAIIFQPGSGGHARQLFLAGGLLAQRGYHFLAVDRPGHGLSGGARGDCTIEEAIAVSASVIEHARRRWGLPVVLMGSSMGGLLTIFALLEGLKPDLAVAHNFVYPGKLLSMRLRARWIARHRNRPYPLTELVHGFENLSADPSIRAYLRSRSDPGAAWELSVRSVASLFGFVARAPSHAQEMPETLLITGDRDKAIPAWATRWFARWSGLPKYEVAVLPNAGHMLFYDHLDLSVPLIAAWLDTRLPSASPVRRGLG